MLPDSKSHNGKFCHPAIYQIRVEGVLGGDFWEIFVGNSELVDQDNEENCNTKITVRITDQAQLNGMLNTLYDWHFTLLSLERLEKENETAYCFDGKTN